MCKYCHLGLNVKVTTIFFSPKVLLAYNFLANVMVRFESNLAWLFPITRVCHLRNCKNCYLGSKVKITTIFFLGKGGGWVVGLRVNVSP